jgi:hypothetical protein
MLRRASCQVAIWPMTTLWRQVCNTLQSRRRTRGQAANTARRQSCCRSWRQQQQQKAPAKVDHDRLLFALAAVWVVVWSTLGVAMQSEDILAVDSCQDRCRRRHSTWCGRQCPCFFVYTLWRRHWWLWSSSTTLPGLRMLL